MACDFGELLGKGTTIDDDLGAEEIEKKIRRNFSRKHVRGSPQKKIM